MTITTEVFGPFLTEAGRTALSNLEATLQRRPGMWVILANVCLDAPTDDYLEQLHLVVVGPPGVFVCEARRGDQSFIADTNEYLQVAALRTQQKADRLARLLNDAGHTSTVKPVLALHTTDVTRAPTVSLGVPIVSSAQLGSAVGRGDTTLTAGQTLRIVTAITADHHRNDQAINLGRARGLVVEDATGAPFHVVYRARVEPDQPILVHLHDLTAGDRDDAYRVAQRGHDVLFDLAPNPNIPPIVEHLTLHPVPDGDLAWFAVGDDRYRSIAAASTDPDWNIVYRVRFAAQALSVLSGLHRPIEVGIEGLVLRDINPTTVRVALDNQPYFSRFRFARYVGRDTIAPIAGPQWQPDAFTAPEVRDGGLSAATPATDTYSLCASLISILDVPRAEGVRESGLAPLAREILQLGCNPTPSDRPSPIVLAQSLDSLFDDEPVTPVDSGPLADGLDFGYQIVRQLGAGGFGTTYLVRELEDEYERVEPDPFERDCFVAKMPHDPERARRTIRGHKLARPFSAKDRSLAAVLQVAGPEWEPGKPAALITYVQGNTLKSASAALRTGGQSDANLVATCLWWYAQALHSLTCLHPARVHGDVSPDNILVGESHTVLVDYDTVTAPGQVYRGLRLDYASHQRRQGALATCAEDVFACAATIFDCLIGGGFPFMRGGRDNPRDGLAWPSTLPYESLPAFQALKACLDRATSPNESARYRDAEEALKDLHARAPEGLGTVPNLGDTSRRAPQPSAPPAEWSRVPHQPQSEDSLLVGATWWDDDDHAFMDSVDDDAPLATDDAVRNQPIDPQEESLEFFEDFWDRLRRAIDDSDPSPPDIDEYPPTTSGPLTW